MASYIRDHGPIGWMDFVRRTCLHRKVSTCWIRVVSHADQVGTCWYLTWFSSAPENFVVLSTLLSIFLGDPEVM